MSFRFSSRIPAFVRDIYPLSWRQYSSSHFSTIAEVEKISAPRTSIKNPALHTQDHQGLWYTMEPDTVKKLFNSGGFTKKFIEMCGTFTETSLMVREPALAVIDYIKRSNLSMPPNKFLLYGNEGTGKTTCLAHITHFLAEDGWILLHIPWGVVWRRTFKEISPSTTNPGFFDHPIDASFWLQHFKTQNQKLLKDLELTVSEEYVWTRREVTAQGSPLSELVDQGINRSRFSSDVVMALTKELKKHATEGRCKVSMVSDGINTFFNPVSRYKFDNAFVEPQKFTLHQAFSHLFDNSWKNGCIVGTIDHLANEPDRRSSHLPRYLLRRTGWEALDPFVPILVSNYDDREMRSIINYYVDREWLQTVDGTSDGELKEMSVLTNQNPLKIMELCRCL